MKKFNVIIENNGKFESYDIMPYLIDKYNESESKPTTFDSYKEFIEKWSMYQWWARCEYEIILSDWPREKHKEKWDIYRQIMMNIDLITEIFISNVS